MSGIYRKNKKKPADFNDAIRKYMKCIGDTTQHNEWKTSFEEATEICHIVNSSELFVYILMKELNLVENDDIYTLGTLANNAHQTIIDYRTRLRNADFISSDSNSEYSRIKFLY